MASSSAPSTLSTRVLLVCCAHPKDSVEFDPVRDEATAVLTEIQSCLLQDYSLDPVAVLLLQDASPEDVLAEIEKPGNLFFVALGHGGCNKLGEELESYRLRGLKVTVPKRDPQDAEAVWLQLPKGRLTEQMLRTACLDRARKSRLLMFLGTCYSGGFFDQWLPEFLVEFPLFTSTFNFPNVTAVTSADARCQVGSWSWHELVRTLRSPVASGDSLLNFVARLRSLDPTVTFGCEEARGEAVDAAALCLFASSTKAADLTFRKLLGRSLEISDPARRRDPIMKCPVVPKLADDQRIVLLSDLEQDAPGGDHARAFVESIQKNGFAVLDIGEEAYRTNIQTLLDDVKVLLGPDTDDATKQSLFDRTLDKQDENTNCGWAIAPDTWEMYKFVYSGECQEKDEYPWPIQPPGFKSSVVQYYLFAARLAKRLALLISREIGPDHGGDIAAWEELMDPDPVPRDYYSNNDCRLFRYYGSSEMSTELFQGEAHADLGLLAVGPLSDVDGIHFFDRRDLVWRAPERDSTLKGRPLIAVWPGDLMRCLTGGYVAGGLHRVKLSPGSQDRYSMPFFIRARRSCALKCLAKLPPKTTKTSTSTDDQESYTDYTEYEDKRFRYTQAAGGSFWYIPPF